MNISSEVKQKKCSNCGSAFSCGNTESGGNCWCNAYPPIFQPDSGADCFCPVCLKEVTLNKINEYVSALGPVEALNNKAKYLPNTEKQLLDIDYYMENGYQVFTAWYHLKRGYCCNNGCRHCPYDIKISNQND